MHPRCRSTISAVVEGGKRIAKSKGRNIRVPAEMHYADYKAVYLDKSLTFENWRKNNSERLITGGNVNAPLQQRIKAAEDKAFNAATGTDFGFKKLTRTANWAAEISYVNGDGKGLERMINCQRCVVALEARMRGYDVIARPSYGVADKMRTVESLLSVFDNTNSILKLSKEELAGDIIESVESIVKSFGKGSRAFIWFYWDENKSYKRGGHIISAQCQEKSVVNISDGQSKSMVARQQLTEAVAESICIMRVDDLKFTELVKRCCMNRGDSNDNA